ncbi:MAG: alpha-hydroxy-acid oxidizing enzyme [Azorhizobium sp. 12-66-6]|nr:MAG: alpha-hydroxy-acid oxidizing enzyme [Azorhizobium sp. 12-66-6]
MSPPNASPKVPVSLCDYAQLALHRLDPNALAYINGGAADEITLRDNQEAFDRIRLQSTVLRDFRGATTRSRLLGLDLDHPIFVAPMAYHRLAHAEGELATVKGAHAAGAPLVVSTQASASLEDIARGATAPLWFQLYIQQDREFTRWLVARAVACGYSALVVTVDAPASLRNREQRIGFRLPAGIEAVNLGAMATRPTPGGGIGESPLFSGFLAGAPTWNDIIWLRSLTSLPLLLKGILNPADARRALALGIDGLIVSNHGGRVLDTLPASIDALPAIAAEVNGAVPLLLDGGIRRGTDIVKALARGASAVLVGRPILHALAAAGAPGVAHALHLLRAELEVAMTLVGCTRLDEITPDVLFAS